MNEDILSAPLALAQAQANGDSSKPSMSFDKVNFLFNIAYGKPMAQPAGETCLKEVAGKPKEADNS